MDYMQSDIFDPYPIAEVLSGLRSRQYGRSIVIEISPKAGDEKQLQAV